MLKKRPIWKIINEICEEENINVLEFICERLFYQDLTLNDEVEIAEELEEKNRALVEGSKKQD